MNLKDRFTGDEFTISNESELQSFADAIVCKFRRSLSSDPKDNDHVHVAMFEKVAEQGEELGESATEEGKETLFASTRWYLSSRVHDERFSGPPLVFIGMNPSSATSWKSSGLDPTISKIRRALFSPSESPAGGVIDGVLNHIRPRSITMLNLASFINSSGKGAIKFFNEASEAERDCMRKLTERVLRGILDTLIEETEPGELVHILPMWGGGVSTKEKWRQSISTVTAIYDEYKGTCKFLGFLTSDDFPGRTGKFTTCWREGNLEEIEPRPLDGRAKHQRWDKKLSMVTSEVSEEECGRQLFVSQKDIDEILD